MSLKKDYYTKKKYNDGQFFFKTIDLRVMI